MQRGTGGRAQRGPHSSRAGKQAGPDRHLRWAGNPGRLWGCRLWFDAAVLSLGWVPSRPPPCVQLGELSRQAAKVPGLMAQLEQAEDDLKVRC